MTDTIDKLSYDHYGLPMFQIDGNEYAVAANEAKANNAAEEYIKDSLWAFTPSFIISHSNLPPEAIEMISPFQEKKCEGANGTIKSLIKDMDKFVSDAIAADGRGHFLSLYDGKEVPLSSLDKNYWGQVLGALGLNTKDLNNVLLYRIN